LSVPVKQLLLSVMLPTVNPSGVPLG
jgi:hypothetical protein